jgi:hypothetical protein
MLKKFIITSLLSTSMLLPTISTVAADSWTHPTVAPEDSMVMTKPGHVDYITSKQNQVKTIKGWNDNQAYYGYVDENSYWNYYQDAYGYYMYLYNGYYYYY